MKINVCFVVLFVVFNNLLFAGNWPMWKLDASRSANTSEVLPENLKLQWTRKLDKPITCWPENQVKLQFDTAYEPIYMDGLLIVPSMIDGSVTAYQASTGKEEWRFYTEGPVRFAPLAWKDKVFVVSDDGYLYALGLKTGTLEWKFRGGSGEHRLLGNGRIINLHPARGAPVVYDETIYFGAGIWPFMGTFIHAINADTGEVVWTNSGSGSDYQLQPHSTPAFAGVSPQGYFAADEEKLYVAGGRSVPAVYDRKTGKLLYFNMNDKNGAYGVSLLKDNFALDNALYSKDGGGKRGSATCSVIGKDSMWGIEKNSIVEFSSALVKSEYKDRKGKKRTSLKVKKQNEFSIPNGFGRLLLKAGDRFYGGGDGFVYGVDDKGKLTSSAGDPGGEPIIEKGASWSYLLSDPSGENWSSVGFDDSNWKKGNAGFGYGDNDDRTELKMRGHTDKLFIRKEFNLDSVPSGIKLVINYDDAFIAYINGKEVLRVGVKGEKVSGHEASGHESFDVENKYFKQGSNAIAIKGLNAGLKSSDFTLDPYLEMESQSKDPKVAEVSKASNSSWKHAIEGELKSLISADGYLFASTTEGYLYCFSDSAKNSTKEYSESYSQIDGTSSKWKRFCSSLLEGLNTDMGFVIVDGIENGDLIKELLANSKFHVIALDNDAEIIDQQRGMFSKYGLLGKRVTLIKGDLSQIPFASYLAKAICSEKLPSGVAGKEIAYFKKISSILRPYGGRAIFDNISLDKNRLEVMLPALEGIDVSITGSILTLKKEGALPGSDSWTHQYGDTHNSVFSKDSRVKAPLGILWFGGPSHLDVLPRHGHGPPELIFDGRLIIQGIGVISARDVYTGQVLWRREFSDLDTFGMYYDSSFKDDPHSRSYNQKHIPGANQYGSNLVSDGKKLFLNIQNKVLVLDPKTGDVVQTIKPTRNSEGEIENIGFIAATDKYFIHTSAPLQVRSKKKGKGDVTRNARFGAGSTKIVVRDISTGAVLWSRNAEYNFRHNSIIINKDMLYLIDGVTKTRMFALNRNEDKVQAKLLALDLKTGKEKWLQDENVFGTWLSYSSENNILLMAGSKSRDRSKDEVSDGMAAYNATTGSVLWRNKDSYLGPVILRHKTIITQPNYGTQETEPAFAFDLLTGKPLMTKDPVTKKDELWSWVRYYGCNTAIGSENLLTFRSGSGAYIDLTDGGKSTVQLGGFKSGCSSNMIAADGVMNAPDYTRTCTCSYQNQTSLALIHWPDDNESSVVESWGFMNVNSPKEPLPLSRVNLNFGAAGNRRDTSGDVWLESPDRGGPSPVVPVMIKGDFRFNRVHSSLVEKSKNDNASETWVGSSSIEGVGTITIRPFLQPSKSKKSKISGIENMRTSYGFYKSFDDVQGELARPQTYTVRLHFCDTTSVKAGDRVFDITIKAENESSVKGIDVFSSVQGKSIPCSITKKGIMLKDNLNITLSKIKGLPPILSGIELVKEK